MLRADYMFVNNEMFIKNKEVNVMNINYFKNRFYRNQLDFLNRAQMLLSTFDNSSVEMQEKYKFGANIFKVDWLNPLQSSHSNQIISGQLNGFSSVKSMQSKDAIIKLLNLSINIREQKITEANIQTFFK